MKKDEIVSNQKKVPHLLLSEPTRRSLGRVGITALPFSFLLQIYERKTRFRDYLRYWRGRATTL
jgi:hypothetical protein